MNRTLREGNLDASLIQKKMRVLNMFGPGAPYSDEDIKNAPSEIEGKTEMDAVIAYLQNMGTAIKMRR